MDPKSIAAGALLGAFGSAGFAALRCPADGEDAPQTDFAQPGSYGGLSVSEGALSSSEYRGAARVEGVFPVDPPKASRSSVQPSGSDVEDRADDSAAMDTLLHELSHLRRTRSELATDYWKLNRDHAHLRWKSGEALEAFTESLGARAQVYTSEEVADAAGVWHSEVGCVPLDADEAVWLCDRLRNGDWPIYDTSGWYDNMSISLVEEFGAERLISESNPMALSRLLKGLPEDYALQHFGGALERLELRVSPRSAATLSAILEPEKVSSDAADAERR